MTVTLTRIMTPVFLWLVLSTTGPACAEPLVFAGVEGSVDVNVGARIVQEAYRRLGIENEIRWMNASEALDLSNRGIIDGEVSRIDGIARIYDNLIQVHVPVNYLQIVAFARTDTIAANQWHSLRPYQIGIISGILFAEEGTRGMNVTRFDDYNTLIRGVQNEDVDVAIMPRISGIQLMRNQNLRGIVQAEGVLEQLFLYHYVHKKHKDLVPRLTTVFKSMLEDLTIQQARTQILEGQ